ncbi:MAG: DUF2905 domain-containing protein [Spirochaetia bacterium]|nr:DUF2905 domain-containing protein [Spirochaetia bacterium]
MNEAGKQIIWIGIFVILAGIIIAYKNSIPWINKPGKLPGDIVIQKENFSFYFPVVSGLVISLLLSLIFYLFRK